MGQLNLEAVELALASESVKPAESPQSPPKPNKRAAVAAVLREGTSSSGGLDILFIRRAEHPNDPWSGHIAFPGGRVDPTDASLRAAAERETQEEVGLSLSSARLLGRLEPLAAFARGRPANLTVYPFVYGFEGQSVLDPDPQEVAEAFWYPLEALRSEARETFSYAAADATYRLPFVALGEHRLWGLTLRLVDALVTRLT